MAAMAPLPPPQVERKVRLLEDRLQQASVRHSEMLARNRALRAAVDGLRRERMLFDALGAKLRRGLEARQADMVDLIARIAEAHEAGEKASPAGSSSGSGTSRLACLLSADRM